MGGLPPLSPGVCIWRGGFGWRCVSLHQSDRKSNCLSPTASSIFSLPCPSLSHLLALMAGTGLIAHASLPCSWTFGCNVWLDGTANTFRQEVWHCCGLHTFAASQYRCTAASLGRQDSPGLSVPIAVCVKAHIWSCIIFCHYIHVSSHISPYKYITWFWLVTCEFLQINIFV